MISFYIFQILTCLDIIGIFDDSWVYLAIPLINKLIQDLSSKELDYFVTLIFVSSILYQLFYYFQIQGFLDLGFFIGPISYLILGYYLSKKEFNRFSTNKIITICLLVFLIVTLLKIFGVLGIVPHSLAVNFRPTNTDITLSWLDVGVLELIQTASVFIIFKYLYKSTISIYGGIKNILQKNISNNFIVSVSRSSYGMYLINRTLMLFCDYIVYSLMFLPFSNFILGQL